MDDLDILRQMIKPSAQAEQDEKYGKKAVCLYEPQAPKSMATIHNLPRDAVVIKVDLFRSPDDIFNGRNGECKRADFVIISQERQCVVYVELKQTKEQWVEIVRQLKGAACFVKYCEEIGKNFWSKGDFLQGYRHRFVSIGHTSIAKKKTRITRMDSRHDTPERAMKIDWPHRVEFNLLVGT